MHLHDIDTRQYVQINNNCKICSNMCIKLHNFHFNHIGFTIETKYNNYCTFQHQKMLVNKIF